MPASILIVDGDLDFAQSAKSALEQSGDAVDIREEASIDDLRTLKPDVLILSAELPSGRSGFSICSRVRKDERLKGTLILLTSSARTAEALRKHAQRPDRANDYALKPMTSEDLVARVSRLVAYVDRASEDSPNEQQAARPSPKAEPATTESVWPGQELQNNIGRALETPPPERPESRGAPEQLAYFRQLAKHYEQSHKVALESWRFIQKRGPEIAGRVLELERERQNTSQRLEDVIRDRDQTLRRLQALERDFAGYKEEAARVIQDKDSEARQQHDRVGQFEQQNAGMSQELMKLRQLSQDQKYRLQALQEEHGQLQKEKNSLTRHLEETFKQAGEHAQNVDGLERQLQATEALASSRADELAEIRAELQTHVHASDQEKQALIHEYDERIEQLSLAHEHEVQQLTQAHKEHQESLEDEKIQAETKAQAKVKEADNRRKADLKELNTRQKKRVDGLTSKHASEISTLNESLFAAEGLQTKLRADLEGTEQQLSELKNTLVERDQQLETLNKKLFGAKKLRSKQDQKLGAAQEELRTEQENRKRLENEIESQRQQKLEADNEVQRLRDLTQKLEKEHAETESTLAQSQKRLEAEQERLLASEKSLKTLERSHSEERKFRAQLENGQNERDARIHELAELLEQARSESTQLTDQLVQAGQELSAQAVKLENLSGQNDNIQKELERTQEQSSARNNKLEEQLERLDSERAALADLLEAEQDKATVLANDMEQLEQKQKTDLQELHRKIESLEATALATKGAHEEELDGLELQLFERVAALDKLRRSHSETEKELAAAVRAHQLEQEDAVKRIHELETRCDALALEKNELTESENTSRKELEEHQITLRESRAALADTSRALHKSQESLAKFLKDQKTRHEQKEQLLNKTRYTLAQGIKLLTGREPEPNSLSEQQLTDGLEINHDAYRGSDDKDNTGDFAVLVAELKAAADEKPPGVQIASENTRPDSVRDEDLISLDDEDDREVTEVLNLASLKKSKR